MSGMSGSSTTTREPLTSSSSKGRLSDYSSTFSKEKSSSSFGAHASIDGPASREFSMTDFGDVNSTCLNQKSSSTSFKFDYEKQREEIAEEEHVEEIRYVKAFVVILLTLFAIAVSLAVFFSVRKAERNDFETAFFEGADSIVETMERKFGLQLRALDSLAVHTTSWARGSSSSWPTVTVPDFDIRGASIRSFASTMSVVLMPMVVEQNRLNYEVYTRENRFKLGDEEEVRTSNLIFKATDNGFASEEGPGPFFPAWTMSPTTLSLVNFNVASDPTIAPGLLEAFNSKSVLLSSVLNASESVVLDWIFLNQQQNSTLQLNNEPLSNLYVPLFDWQSNKENTNSTPVGMFMATMAWRTLLGDTPGLDDDDSYVAVLTSDCDEPLSFQIQSSGVEFLGRGDRHDRKMDDCDTHFSLADFRSADHVSPGSRLEFNTNYCPYKVTIYPHSSMYGNYKSRRPVSFALSIVGVCLLAALVFGCYDMLMERRQKRVLQTALEARAIVASLFPAQFRGRLFPRQREIQGRFKNMLRFGGSRGSGSPTGSPTHSNDGDEEGIVQGDIPTRPSLVSQSTLRLKNYLHDSSGSFKFSQETVEPISRPIADLFSETTVLFGDVCGFTSWCSQRHPEQVFLLLESIYKGFDKIARKRDVFKVETVGDSYLAVTGLPDPQRDHSWRMAKFALDCRNRMTEILRDLECTLGPDTSELSMRFGIHSGPTTAGVLRGDRSRFQLFGDTVNTASRMESTGKPNRIQISQATADNLRQLGKGAWLRDREDLVEAKGKGKIRTYWLASRPRPAEMEDSLRSLSEMRESLKCLRLATVQQDSSKNMSIRMSFGAAFSDSESSDDDDSDRNTTRTGHMSTLFEGKPTEQRGKLQSRRRVILWQSELLLRSLKKVVAFRGVTRQRDISSLRGPHSLDTIVLDEVADTIEMPAFDAALVDSSIDPDQVSLSPAVITQLHDFVGVIAALYNDNGFHNFEHATHVAMSATKLLSRIVVPECVDVRVATELNASTHGINSDPLTQFAIIFAALIHDCDHPGVPNSQLAREDEDLALLYRYKSIAEQKSFDIAWDVLMDPKYLDLRACIYTNVYEFHRFRQLLINCVLATDIFDSDMQQSRKERWAIVFAEEPAEQENIGLANRRATCVIENLIQVADIAHTMQHWHVYRKWNERLFTEQMQAFLDGRAETDPSFGWYEGELSFFDNYVIPLARRLQDCEVFGIAGSECMSYAQDNREEWESKGRDVVRTMLETFHTFKEMQNRRTSGSFRLDDQMEEENTALYHL